jgi:hypothetical protein
MNQSDLLYRLASACAHGSSQQALVNEMIAGPSYKSLRKVGNDAYVVYGLIELGTTSFKNLRRRLHSVGFVVLVNHESGKVTMTFPEQESKS